MVNIYLSVDNSQVLFLSIPLSDVQRLSIRPLKWLRFVMFTVCGARGDLFETPGGPSVNYDVSFADLVESYHYKSDEAFIFVDYNGLNDRITSSAQTPRRGDFRQDVIEQQGEVCVITSAHAGVCDAAHIIPRSKGNEYITLVVRDRRSRYDPTPELDISDIDAVENGIFLRKDLHAKFALGHAAFLKTPNFALDPVDVPRVEVDPLPPSRITLQLFVPQTGRLPIPGFDACFTGTGESLPSAILLDYVYGTAAYNRWGVGDAQSTMRNYFLEHYESIPIPPRSVPSTESGGESDDARDGDWEPRTPKNQQNHESRKWRRMSDAMDNMNFVMMSLSGMTPEAMHAKWKKEAAEEQLMAQEASQAKVQEWIQTSLPTDLSIGESIGAELIEQ